MITRPLIATAWLLALACPAHAQTAGSNPPSDVDAQARRIEQQMTDDERVRLTHGIMALPIIPGTVIPKDAVLGAGYIQGVGRLGVPSLKETDASLGVAYISGLRHDGATPLPSGLATASTFDPDIAYDEGAMIGQEAWRKGFNVLLAGGANLARDPRNGRNFEYLGEDPLLTGTLAGEAVRGIQDQHVISTLKHFAINDQETGRQILSSDIGQAAARESDLLAFEIALERGHPGALMCSYNKVNGDYACDNDVLLNQVAKRDWAFRGWVMSDWGAVPGLDSALHGLDQQSGAQLDRAVFFEGPLEQAARTDGAYRERLADMNHRILRSMLAVGVIDHPPFPSPIDFDADAQVARRAAEQGLVLLVNRDLLPLAKSARTIAVVGGHADAGVISGGGSSQVAPPEGPGAEIPMGGNNAMDQILRKVLYQPSSPLKAIKAADPAAQVRFYDGAYPKAAAMLAASSDVAIVFATQWMAEGDDAPDLSLPQGQDALIAAVAAANPRTIVVLETGGPVLMPWLDKVAAVVEAWYPGARGGQAIAGVLFGDINPSGRLPITFPASLDQLPRPEIPGWGRMDSGFETASETKAKGFGVDYNIEGSDIGYRWYARQNLKPLFPFGYGLSYARFSQDNLKVSAGAPTTVSFTATNLGARPGVDTPQVYLVSGPQGARRRLLGFRRVTLNPGETKTVTLSVDPRLLADWDSDGKGWRVQAGEYRIAVGEASDDVKLATSVRLRAARLAP
jgi:beta-glucosidase